MQFLELINPPDAPLLTGGTSTAYTATPSIPATSYAAGQKWLVKFNAASGDNPTLAVSGVATPPQLVKRNPDGTLSNIVANEIPANWISVVTMASTTQAIVELLPRMIGGFALESVEASVASNALTTKLNSTTIDFRSTTLGDGKPNRRAVPSQLSLVIPSGATLGTVNGQQSALLLLAIDNAGTVELAVVNMAGNLNLDETGVINTTAITAGASSASTVYSTTARTGVPYRVVGMVVSTQATAGTWATAPSLVQGAGGEALGALSGFGQGSAYTAFFSNGSGSGRALSTTYYNSSSRPRLVLFTGYNAGVANAYAYVTINGVANIEICRATAVGAYASGIFVVPPYGSYSITGGTINTIDAWAEL